LRMEKHGLIHSRSHQYRTPDRQVKSRQESSATPEAILPMMLAVAGAISNSEISSTSEICSIGLCRSSKKFGYGPFAGQGSEQIGIDETSGFFSHDHPNPETFRLKQPDNLAGFINTYGRTNAKGNFFIAPPSPGQGQDSKLFNISLNSFCRCWNRQR